VRIGFSQLSSQLSIEKRLAFGEADLILADVRKAKILCALGSPTKRTESLWQMMREGNGSSHPYSSGRF
jgi:hypothetical protein